MSSRFRSVFARGAVLLLTVFAGTGPARAADLTPYYTPAPGGAAFVQAAAMVTVTNKYVPDFPLVQEATTGSLQILRKMMAKVAENKDCVGICGVPDAWNAYKGNAEYAGKPFSNLRAAMATPGIDLYLAVPANSPIKTYADVKGKRIGMGGPGSSPANAAHFLLEQFGVTKKDFKPQYYTYKETMEGIQDGSLDGGFLAGDYPMASFSELSSRMAVRIVPVDEAMLKKIVVEHPYYRRDIVKAKSYKGVDQDVPIFGWISGLWVPAGMSNDKVYKFIKNLFEHRDELAAVHPSLKQFKPEIGYVQGFPIPYHPGAEKYFREVGLWK